MRKGILYNIQCTVYSVQCTVYSVQCTVYSVQRTVKNALQTVYSIYSLAGYLTLLAGRQAADCWLPLIDY